MKDEIYMQLKAFVINVRSLGAYGLLYVVIHIMDHSSMTSHFNCVSKALCTHMSYIILNYNTSSFCMQTNC